MGEKDIAQKILEAHNDVFSDIVNVLLFNGKEVLSAQELEDQSPNSFYKADGKLRGLERDVAKRWKMGNIRLACVGLENQTSADSDMPLRVMGYDGAEYRSQLLGDKETKSRYPVVTLVLYYGYKDHWNQPTSLKERLDIPAEFDPYINDYKLNLFEIAFLRREQVELFRSDFRIVADYFVQMRENGDYVPDPRQLQHVQETLHLLSVMTQDNRFEEAYHNAAEGGPQNMCEWLDRVENKGRIEGRAEGELKGKQETAVNLYHMGMDLDFIAKAVNVSIDLVKQWLAPVSA